MNRLAKIALLCLLPCLALAQDNTTSEQDKGFLTNWLENNLSGAGREVRIEGFAGALSSTARMEKLTIADEEGIWITLENATLDWNRSALLRGNLSVNELSAASIELVRWPVSTAAAPTPEASEFKLPELPVTVQINSLSVESVTLGADILGEQAVVSLAGSLELVAGDGRADIAIARIDEKNGSLDLKASYSNSTKQLGIDLSVSEEPGGIAVNLLNIPEAPSLDLNVSGTGPTSDFHADLELATDGAPRVTGAVHLTSSIDDSGGTTKAFQADLSGDVAPLLAQRFRAFVGESAELRVAGALLPDKRFEISEFKLDSAALRLGGTLALSEDGLPEAFDVAGSISPVSGDDVVLPISGPETRIGSAKIKASFVAGTSDDWFLDAEFIGLRREGFSVGSGKITAKGLIQRILVADETKRRVTATIGSDLSGVSVPDPATQAAIGSSVSANVALDWQDGDPVRIGFIDLRAGDLGLIGSGGIEGFDRNFRLSADIAANLPSLARFSALADRPLEGSLQIGLRGWYEPLGGAFDADIDGKSKGLELGTTPAIGLVEGDGSFELKAARDTAGLTIEAMSVKTSELSAELAGLLKTNASDLRASVALRDLSRLVTGINGPADLSGTVRQDGPGWNLDLSGSGPGRSRLALRGSVAQQLDTVDLLVTGALPVGLVNGFVSAPIDVQGTANFDLAIKGKPSLDAISGTVSTTDSRISVPAMRIALRKIEATAQLSGGRAALAVAGGFSSGGRVKVDGTLGLSQPFTADMKIDLVNAEFTDAPTYTTTANGTLTIAGPLVGGASLAGKLELSNTEIRLAPTTSGRGIPEIRHLGESPAVAKTRERAGLVVSEDRKQDSGSSRPLNLDILIDAPNRIFIRGRGLDTELGGSLRITGTTAAVIPIGQFDLIRGRMDILGKRLEMQEGRLLIQGTLDPWFRMVAATKTSNANVRIITEGTPQSPTVTFESDPDLPDDEILANLLFGRDAASMSPLQAAQLAAAVATLAGNGGDGALGRLRQRLNLDDFDLTTDDNGAAALRFGKYLSDNVYSDVELSSEGRSQINLNLDITPSIVAKGRLDSDGETGLGVFFEKDY